jgi:type 1 fimbria pilin
MSNGRRAWCLLALLGAPMLGMAGGGTAVNFTGTLVNNMCTFEQGDAPLVIEMPSQTVRFFSHYGRSEVKAFDIGLKNCTASTQGKLVKFTFTAPRTKVIGGVTMLDTDGGTGLVIGLVDGVGKDVSLGSAVSAGNIAQTGQGTVNRFRFAAFLTTLDPTKVREGAYTATVTFQLAYQ